MGNLERFYCLIISAFFCLRASLELFVGTEAGNGLSSLRFYLEQAKQFSSQASSQKLQYCLNYYLWTEEWRLLFWVFSSHPLTEFISFVAGMIQSTNRLYLPFEQVTTVRFIV